MNDSQYYYQILELAPGASQEAVHQAYKDLAFVWHPDRMPDDNPRLKEKAEDKLKGLNEARQFFRDYFRQAATQGASQTAQAQQAQTAQSSGFRSNPFYRAARSRHRPPAESPQDTNASPGSGNGFQRPPADPATASAPPKRPTAAAPQRPKDFEWHQTPPRSGQSPHTSGQSPHTSGQSPHTSQPEPPPRSRPPIVPPDWAMGSRPPRRTGPDLSGRNLSGANLRERDFSGRNLSGADLSGADLSDAFLHQVNLQGAKLTGAKLFRANLLQADLRGADLSGANLISADLSGANLTGADLTGARITVSGRLMVKLTGAILDGAIVPQGLAG
ncbi:MAG: pentapeptide repeat-containing protein [Cyanobacteria bacterium]|nr:pentapeptide repeat-containing protein [Cyanobacteriota bacterium]